MTQRGELATADIQLLLAARETYLEAEAAAQIYRKVAVEMVNKSSYREVARLTGLSTNTLQRWKREAGK